MRQRLVYVAVSVLLAAGAGYLAAGGVPARSTTLTVRSVRSVVVPGQYGPLSVGDGELELANCYVKDTSAQDVGSAVLIDPTSLAMRPMPCSSFALGENLTLTAVHESSQQNIWSCEPDSLGAQVMRKRPGGAMEPVGRPLFGYSGTCSHTAPLTAYGADSLWVYDCSAGPSGHGGRIVELSASTGRVELSYPMATMCWTSFAADDDGAFVATYEPGTRPVGQPAVPSGISFVANGASHASLALRTSGAVLWLYGVGDATYADVVGRPSSCAPIRCGIWRLEGPSAMAQLVTPEDDSASFNAPVGNDVSGLFVASEVPFPHQPPGLSYEGPSTFELHRLDLATGTWQRLATLRLSYPTYDLPHLAYLDGDLFAFLDGRLYRYQPS